MDKLPGVQYIPSNGTDGVIFLESWCARCARDREWRDGTPFDECDESECCPIIAASFLGQAVEWRELDNGETICTAFVPAGDPVSRPRCSRTADMFEGEAQG